MPLLRIGLSERLSEHFGRIIVDEIPTPPAIPGWRLVDPEDIPDVYRGQVLIVAIACKGTTRFMGRTVFTPTADAFYLPQEPPR
jgi:hypothetical protein